MVCGKKFEKEPCIFCIIPRGSSCGSNCWVIGYSNDQVIHRSQEAKNGRGWVTIENGSVRWILAKIGSWVQIDCYWRYT